MTTPRRQFWCDLAIALSLAAGVVAALIWWGGGLSVREHPVALVVTVGTLATLCWRLIGSREWLLAGAQWLQQGKSWVSLYELSDVTVNGSDISFADSAGRSVHSLDLTLAQRNQRLWDLVYNGIAASMRTGALVLDETAALLLVLPPPTAPTAPTAGDEVASAALAEPAPHPVNPIPWRIGAGLSALAAGFFGVIAVGTFAAPEPELPTRMGFFFAALALILAMMAAGAGRVLRLCRTDPTVVAGLLGPERWWSTPAFVVNGLLIAVAGVAVLDSAPPIGAVMTFGGVVAPVWQVLLSRRSRGESGLPGRHAHEAGTEASPPQ
ncbi:hypothetical protein H7J77_09155 [Mycolicibacillus parakoreensis]|uniref:Uncharacterized protein n=1 Tax=Mycolicibacillus parakoreensis TaxID=1069221 RepID=A0ABY3TVV7_9MYCO|nr:hypothetical protein [Mycolicibacillus parakoreensis]MCV7315709.1 hypothetical protein [Mycolicibacillus parakoreensis]ULN51854.1 hypothetical protein MIU77_13335 [Mycolicibacillus parakoreensis]